MLKLIKFKRLKDNTGFGVQLSSELLIKTGKNEYYSKSNTVSPAIFKINPEQLVWADDSQIKPWWKLW